MLVMAGFLGLAALAQVSRYLYNMIINYYYVSFQLNDPDSSVWIVSRYILYILSMYKISNTDAF